MTLLLLGGTREGRALAQRFAQAGIDAWLSVAFAERAPKNPPLPMRAGGFGGADGFARFAFENNISAVLDATHPCSARMTERTARLCAKQGIPYAYVLRPPWTPVDGDRWLEVDREEDAARHIALDATVFLGTGRQSLERFSNLVPRRVICRQLDAPSGPFPFDGGEFLIGTPPFSVPQEEALFARLKVDWLIVKNAGGASSYTKLEACRNLGIPVIMLKRPKSPDALILKSVDAAFDWACGQ